VNAAPTSILRDEVLASLDQRVCLPASYRDYLALDRARGPRRTPRLTYACGILEIMTVSPDHEFIKKTIARVIEACCDELGVAINGFGSWTLQAPAARQAIEPDECYVIGEDRHPKRPDLAIEVIWTHGGVDKLEVYRALGVREVWFWQDGGITVHELFRGKYRKVPKSRLLPALDLALIGELATFPSQSAAIRELRHRLRAR
jgi:Uma2 family endonuclease